MSEENEEKPDAPPDPVSPYLDAYRALTDAITTMRAHVGEVPDDRCESLLLGLRRQVKRLDVVKGRLAMPSERSRLSVVANPMERWAERERLRREQEHQDIAGEEERV